MVKVSERRLAVFKYVNQHRVQRLHTNLPAPIYLCHQWSCKWIHFASETYLWSLAFKWHALIGSAWDVSGPKKHVRWASLKKARWQSESPIDYMKHHANSSSSKTNRNKCHHKGAFRKSAWLTLLQKLTSLRSSPISEHCQSQNLN